MEYVANAQGQDVAVAPVLKTAVQPASIGVSATLAPALGAAAAIPASSTPTAVKLVGLSTLERLKDEWEAEVARIERDATAVKSFASSVVASGKADVVKAETIVDTIVEAQLTEAKTWTLTHGLTFIVGTSVGIAAQALWKFL